MFTLSDLGVGECAGEVVSLFSIEIAKAESEAFEVQVALDAGRYAEADERAYLAMLMAAVFHDPRILTAMSVSPSRISLKLELGDAPAFDPAACIPVFHDWIRRNALDELLIDVADYRHVDNGPGILLVALEADYGVETIDGRHGLRYTRKRKQPRLLADALLLAYRQAVSAWCLLSEAPAMPGAFPATHAGVEIQLLDRLRYPNTEDVRRVVAGEVDRLFESIYAGGPVEVAVAEPDERRPLTVRITADPPAVVVLGHRLDALTAGAALAASER